MWFNSMIREEPYLLLTYLEPFRDERVLLNQDTGAAWLSSARVVRCWVKSRNERNPCRLLPSLSWELRRDCRPKPEEGGDDVKSAWPLCPGLHTCYNGWYKEMRARECQQTSKNQPQFGLESATRLHEAGIASNRRSACFGEYVPGSCTHRPSHHGSRLLQKWVA